MSKAYIFGHKNPDSDTICSTLAYHELKRALGQETTPVKLGNINSETKFILQYFNIDEPETLDTIKTQVSDIEYDKPLCVAPSTPMHTAWNLISHHEQKGLIVVNPSGEMIGVATLSDITKNYMEIGDDTLLAKGHTPYSNIIETLDANVVCGDPEARFVTGSMGIAAQHHSRLKEFVNKGDIMIASIDENIRESITSGASMIVCTCGARPKQADIDLAAKNDCVVISTIYDTFTTSMLIRQSVPVEYVMSTENVVTVRVDEFKKDVKERMIKTRFRSYPVIGLDGTVVGMISRYHLLSKTRKKAILLDHNEKNQTAKGIDEAEILEIIDHHRLGDLQTKNPILIKNEPVGSTATIIAGMYNEHKKEIPKSIAGILLSAIISDTLNFQSPTTTRQDIEAADRLEIIAEVNKKDLALKIINAGSTLTGKTPEQVVNGDLKEYELGKYKIGIAQVYSIDHENLSSMHASLIERMNYDCEKNGYAILMLLVTDLHRGGSEVLLVGEHKDILYKAYSLHDNLDPMFLPGVLSRKKQVLPQIMSIEEEL